MKKILIVLTILFCASLGCKKANIDGGLLCACSPVRTPALNLVIKNTSGHDLLSEKTAGAYSKDKIELFRKDAQGNIIPIAFSIRPPFFYGNEKFDFNSLYIADARFSQDPTGNIIFLKLGPDRIYELNFLLNPGKYDIDKLFIDKKEAEKDSSNLVNYTTVFYLIE